MLFIGGVQDKGKVLKKEMRPCTVCRRNTLHVVGETSRWLTLFFIPVVPFSRGYVRQCSACGYTARLTEKEALRSQPPRADVCPNCGAKIAPEAVARGDAQCVLCGHPLPHAPESVPEEDVCPSCGAEILPTARQRGDRFCGQCGQPLPPEAQGRASP